MTTKPRESGPNAQESTSERILAAATTRFAAAGYVATSLNDVADDVGIRTPSLYKHFASKRALYEAVLDRLLSPYAELLASVLVVPESAEHAEQNLLAVSRHYLANPDLARVVQYAALNGGEELEFLATRWYEPLLARAAELTPTAPFPVLDERAMGIAIGVHAMLSGFATMAPLHARLLGTDPLSPEGVALQLELMRGMARHFFAEYAPRLSPAASQQRGRTKKRKDVSS